MVSTHLGEFELGDGDNGLFSHRFDHAGAGLHHAADATSRALQHGLGQVVKTGDVHHRMHHGDVFGVNVLGGVGGHGGHAGDHELGDAKGQGLHHAGAEGGVRGSAKGDDPIQLAGLQQFLDFDASALDHDGSHLARLLGSPDLADVSSAKPGHFLGRDVGGDGGLASHVGINQNRPVSPGLDEFLEILGLFSFGIQGTDNSNSL